jgi:hypothetical protein
MSAITKCELMNAIAPASIHVPVALSTVVCVHVATTVEASF